MDKLEQKENNTFAHKKALFVANQDSFVELFLLPCMKMLKERGYEVHVATDTDKTIPLCDKKIKLTIKRSPFKFRDNLKAVRELKKIMAKERYEIVHCHTPVGGVVARLAAKKFRHEGTRVIYTAHGFHFFDGAPLHFWLMFYPVEKWLAKYTDTLITINEEDYKRASNKFSRRCHDIQYVPGVGVDPDKFSKKMSAEERVKYRKLFGLKANDKILICNGRLDANKNQEFLIRVLERLVKKDPTYHLLLVGLDENRGKCQKLALELGLQDNVHFLGFHQDIPELLQISDVAVSASKREGLPVSLMEAAMAGVPIVATDCRGNRDVCRKAGQTIVKQGDLNGFVRGVKNACEEKRSDDAKELRQGFVDEHSVEKVGKTIDEIYNKKRRILHLLSTNKYSGAENVACTIISNLSDDFDMVYCSPRGPIEKIVKERGVEYFGINKLNYKNVKKAVKSFQPDIIHAHDFRASLIASGFSKKCRIISHIHQDNPVVRKFNFGSMIYDMRTKKFVKIIWASNDAFENYFYKKNIIKNSIVLENVVDKYYIEKMADKYNIDESYDVIFLGRLISLKRPSKALEIIRLVKNKKYDIKMAVVGDGDEYDEIKKLINKYGLKENVKMFGYVENPYPILKKARILLITSEREGTPMAVIEALALGKPVVSTRVGENEKIIKNGKNGFIADDNDELADMILKILDGYSLSSSLVNGNLLDEYLASISNIYNLEKCNNWRYSDAK